MSNPPKKVLVTGATGFIGRALLSALSKNNFQISCIVRNFNHSLPSHFTQFKVDSINSKTTWKNHLSDIEIIIHLAASAHDANNKATGTINEVNVAGTTNLAKQAAIAGVHRFIFISSIGVNGNQTTLFPFTEKGRPEPIGAYAKSKHEAEIGLKNIAKNTEMEVVIIRPPLVYGANAPGSFGQLINAIARGIPLPLGSIHNKRSLVFLDNLIDLITICITHPLAKNQIFLVSDNEDISTTELIRKLAKYLGKKSRLVPIPVKIIITLARLLGKEGFATSLCASLQIDISHTKKTLDWSPPVSLDEALQETADHYLKQV